MGVLVRGTLRVYWAPAAPMNVTETESVLDWGAGRALAAVRQAAAAKMAENLIVNKFLVELLSWQMCVLEVMNEGVDERQARLYTQETWKYTSRQQGPTA
jgi:hypothetical protein